MNWTKQQARGYLVNYHMINTNNINTITDVFNRIQSIQYDPLNVVGTNPELVLQARVSNFKKDMLYNALYKERYLIDGWDKQMCIIKASDFPQFSFIRENRASLETLWAKKYLNLEFEHIIEDVYQVIKDTGPILSSKIKIGETKQHRWGHTKASSVAISYLFHKGIIGIDSRNNTQKKYDLIERTHPHIKVENPFISEEEFIEYYLLRRIKSLGLVWNKNSVAFSGLHINGKNIRTKFLDILQNKRLISEITIDGIEDKFYVPTEALEYPIVLNDTITILAPLDNILWDRALVEKLFNFSYTWEVYVPESKRKFGYYVLPLLKGSEIIGRIEFSKQRKKEPLKVIDIWLEPGIKNTKVLKKELDETLHKFAQYLEATEVIYEHQDK